MQMKFRFNLWQAMAVVPDPLKQSRTMSFSLLLCRMSLANMSIGFWVAWIVSFSVGYRRTVFSQNPLNVAPARFPYMHGSIPDSQMYSPFIGLGFVFSHIINLVENLFSFSFFEYVRHLFVAAEYVYAAFAHAYYLVQPFVQVKFHDVCDTFVQVAQAV